MLTSLESPCLVTRITVIFEDLALMKDFVIDEYGSVNDSEISTKS